MLPVLPQVYVTGILTWPNAAFTFLAFPVLTAKFGEPFPAPTVIRVVFSTRLLIRDACSTAALSIRVSALPTALLHCLQA